MPMKPWFITVERDVSKEDSKLFERFVGGMNDDWFLGHKMFTVKLESVDAKAIGGGRYRVRYMFEKASGAEHPIDMVFLGI